MWKLKDLLDNIREWKHENQSMNQSKAAKQSKAWKSWKSLMFINHYTADQNQQVL